VSELRNKAAFNILCLKAVLKANKNYKGYFNGPPPYLFDPRCIKSFDMKRQRRKSIKQSKIYSGF